MEELEADADSSVEVELDTFPETDADLETENLPEPQEFEDILNSDAQDMADYAMQYEGEHEEPGDFEEPADFDIDSDLLDTDLPEETSEIESAPETDIDLSELGEIAEEAEEGAEIIAALL